MNAGAGAGNGSFRSAYASALLDYLLEPSETSLRVAYELAREAVNRSINVLELADAHQQALMSVLLDASDAAEAQAIARAAGDFFLEGLSTFEMVQRGFAEARQAALLERRQTRLSRQLSTFSRTPRRPSTRRNRSRRCCGWWPSRHASSWEPIAA